VQCSEVNCTNPGILQEDPFSAEINDDHTLVWLCDDCAYQSAMDI